jgi:predicted dehydrogenase
MIRLGVVGAGNNGAGHARYYHASPRADVVAVADPDLARAQALAEAVGAEAVPDYRDLLDRVDAVVISSPNFLHREHAIACAEAGLHVFCEKPLGLSYAEARDIVAAVEAADVVSMVGFSVRFGGDVRVMQRLVKAGDLGDVRSIHSRRLHYFDPASMTGWRKDPSLSGGLLLEVNIHELDWMLWLGGAVTSVYARTWAADAATPRANDHVWATLSFANGAVGFHEGSWVSTTPGCYRSVQGTRAGLVMPSWGSALRWMRPGQETRTLEQDAKFDKRARFLDAIEHDADPVVDVRWGLRVMAVAEAILRSAAEGVPVALREVTG